MLMLKPLFQILQIRPILAPGRNSRPLGALLKITARGTRRGIQAFVSQGVTDTTHPWEQLTAQDKNVAVSFT